MAFFAMASSASSTMRGMEEGAQDGRCGRGGSILDATGAETLDDHKKTRGGEHKPRAGDGAAALCATPLRDVLSVVARVISVYEVRMALSLLIGLDDVYGGLKLVGMNLEDFKEVVEEITHAEANGGKLTHAVKRVVQDVKKVSPGTLSADNMVATALRMTMGSHHQHHHEHKGRQGRGSIGSLASTKSVRRVRGSVNSTVSKAPSKLKRTQTTTSISSKISKASTSKPSKKKLHRSATQALYHRRSKMVDEDEDEEDEPTSSFTLRHRGALKNEAHLMSKDGTDDGDPDVKASGRSSMTFPVAERESPRKSEHDEEEMSVSFSSKGSPQGAGQVSQELKVVAKEADAVKVAVQNGVDQDPVLACEADEALASHGVASLQIPDGVASHDVSPAATPTTMFASHPDTWQDPVGDEPDEMDEIVHRMMKHRDAKKGVVIDHRSQAVCVDNLCLSPMPGSTQVVVTEHSAPAAPNAGCQSMTSMSNEPQKRNSAVSFRTSTELSPPSPSLGSPSTSRQVSTRSSSSKLEVSTRSSCSKLATVSISDRLRGSLDEGGLGLRLSVTAIEDSGSGGKSKADRASLRSFHEPPPAAPNRHSMNGHNRWSANSDTHSESAPGSKRDSYESDHNARGSISGASESESQLESDDEEDDEEDDDSDEDWEEEEEEESEESDLDSIFSEDDNLDDDLEENTMPKGMALRKEFADKASGKEGGKGFLRTDLTYANMAAPSHCFIIHPMSRLRMMWDILNMIFILTEIVLLPVSLGFDMEFPLYLDLATTSFFAVDMLMSCITGYFHYGNLVMRLRPIVVNYLRGRFGIDVCATLPWDYVFNSDSSIGLLPRFLRVTCRWARLLRVAELIARLEEMIHSYYVVLIMSLFKTMSSFALLCHWCACVWAFIGTPDRGWGTKYFYQEPHTFDDCTQGGSCELAMEGSPWRRRYAVEKMDFNVQYLMALQFAFGLMTGQDVNLQPGYWLERVYVTLMFALSFLVCTWMVSNIILMLQKINQRKADFREQMLMVKDFMVKRSVPIKLQGKIRSYLEFKYKAKEDADRAGDFIGVLSPWLRLELKDHLYKRLIVLHPFFKQLPDMMIKRVCGAATTAFYAPGDVVFQKGHAATCMCFIVHGRVRVLKGVQVAQDDGQTITRSAILKSPSWIGDMCLFTNMSRARTVLSITHCELLCITKDSIGQLAVEFPKMLNYYKSFKLKVTNGDHNLGTHCQYCHQPGHFVGDCPQLKSRLHGNQESAPANARCSEFTEAGAPEGKTSLMRRGMHRLKETAVARFVSRRFYRDEAAANAKRNAVADSSKVVALGQAEGDRRTGFLMKKKTLSKLVVFGRNRRSEEQEQCTTANSNAMTSANSNASLQYPGGPMTPVSSLMSGAASINSKPRNSMTRNSMTTADSMVSLKRQVSFGQVSFSDGFSKNGDDTNQRLKDDSNQLTGIRESRVHEEDDHCAPQPLPGSPMEASAAAPPSEDATVQGLGQVQSLEPLSVVPTPQQPPPLLPMA